MAKDNSELIDVNSDENDRVRKQAIYRVLYMLLEENR